MECVRGSKDRIRKVWRIAGKGTEKSTECRRPVRGSYGKRTRAIERKLRQVEALPAEDSQRMLSLPELTDDEDDE